MARPRKKPEEKTNSFVKVYLTQGEKQTAIACAGNIPLSEYFRRAGLSARLPKLPPPEINRQTYLELAEVSESLQQIAEAIASCPQAAVDLSYITTLQQHIEQVRWQLISPEAEGP